MLRNETFEKLHELISGRRPSRKSLTILKYEDLTPWVGLLEAYQYLLSSKSSQETCHSDSAYWIYAGDIAVANILIAIFIHLTRGNTEFPDLPDISGKVLMDGQADLNTWARDLVLNSDHKHIWEDCTHNEHTNRCPSHPKCKRGKIDWLGLYHSVCGICGLDKYDTSSVEDTAKEILRQI